MTSFDIRWKVGAVIGLLLWRETANKYFQNIRFKQVLCGMGMSQLTTSPLRSAYLAG